MICYKSVVKNAVNVALFFTIHLFLMVVGSGMIYIFFILAYKKLTPQKLWKYCDNLLW